MTHRRIVVLTHREPHTIDPLETEIRHAAPAIIFFDHLHQHYQAVIPAPMRGAGVLGRELDAAEARAKVNAEQGRSQVANGEDRERVPQRAEGEAAARGESDPMGKAISGLAGRGTRKQQAEPELEAPAEVPPIPMPWLADLARAARTADAPASSAAPRPLTQACPSEPGAGLAIASAVGALAGAALAALCAKCAKPCHEKGRGSKWATCKRCCKSVHADCVDVGSHAPSGRQLQSQDKWECPNCRDHSTTQFCTSEN